jgi:glycine cleavage system aminomethyltransferase T
MQSLRCKAQQAHEVMQSLGVNPVWITMAFAHVSIAGCDVILCRTGYTGEQGFEIVPKVEDAALVWDAICAAMNPFAGLVCGLGARDTLRTEMGYPLHGHELSLEISPVQASAGWAIGWKKSGFVGQAALRAQKESGKVRTLKALTSLDRGIPRAGMKILNSQGAEIGEVTSGTFSPSLKVGIALALIEPGYEVGNEGSDRCARKNVRCKDYCAALSSFSRSLACAFTNSIGVKNAARVCALRNVCKIGLPVMAISDAVKTARGRSHAIADKKWYEIKRSTFSEMGAPAWYES